MEFDTRRQIHGSGGSGHRNIVGLDVRLCVWNWWMEAAHGVDSSLSRSSIIGDGKRDGLLGSKIYSRYMSIKKTMKSVYFTRSTVGFFINNATPTYSRL